MAPGSRAHGSQVDGQFPVSFSQSAGVYDPVKPYCLMQRCGLLDLCDLWLLSLRQRSEGLDEPGAWLQVQPASAGPLVRMPLSSSVWTLSLPPAPRVRLWIPIGCGTLHTRRGAILDHEKGFPSNLACMKQINTLNMRMKGKAKSLLKYRFCWSEMFISFFKKWKTIFKNNFFPPKFVKNMDLTFELRS